MTTATPSARRSDPKTSQAAAREMAATGKAQTQRDLCRVAVRKHPGSTSAEIAEAINLDRYAVSRRLPELRDAGLVVNGPERQCRVTDRTCITWLPAEQAGPATIDVPQEPTKPAFNPDLICPYRSHNKSWKSVYGHHVCGDCHPPIGPHVIAEWIDIGEREQTGIVAQSVTRSKRRLNITAVKS